MYFHQPTSLTGRATESPSPDFLLLLEVKSLFFKLKISIIIYRMASPKNWS